MIDSTEGGAPTGAPEIEKQTYRHHPSPDGPYLSPISTARSLPPTLPLTINV